ncbi:Hypothetical predicted protein, partial [Scomber scombrus]
VCRDGVRGSGGCHGELLHLGPAHHQEPANLHSVLQPPRAEDRQPGQSESSGGAAGHQCCSSAFWEHGVRRGGAGLRSRSESRPANHRRELILPRYPGSPAA